VRVARVGSAGLRLYRDRPFDLVVSDVIMPGMGGAEFVRRLRAHDPSAQIIVATGQASSNQADEMLRSGAFALLNKPFVIDELLDAISRGVYARTPVAA
jgi:two-component system, NtrC family, sensor kinase